MSEGKGTKEAELPEGYRGMADALKMMDDPVIKKENEIILEMLNNSA